MNWTSSREAAPRTFHPQLLLIWLVAAAAIAGIGTAMLVGSGVAAATKDPSSGTGDTTSTPPTKHSTVPAPVQDKNGGKANRSAIPSSSINAVPVRVSIASAPRRTAPVKRLTEEIASIARDEAHIGIGPIAVPSAQLTLTPPVTAPGTKASVAGALSPDTRSPAATPEAATPSNPAHASSGPAPKPATVIDLIATVIFNIYNVALQLIEGPPVLPPGSTVTVATSTLNLGCAATACTVTADWYFPTGSSPQGLIYLQHGFLANAATYSYTAATLAEDTDSVVVAPSLTSNFFAINALWLGGEPMAQAVANLFVGDRAALTDSASAAAGHAVALPARVVLVGHSLGGSLVMGVAGDMADNSSINNLAGVVLFDGVALDPTLVSRTVAKVPSDLPILMIASPPYWLNNFGQTVNALVNARPGQFDGVQLVGGRHIDYMQGGNLLIQLSAYLVSGFSRPWNIDAVKTLASGWINDMFEGTHNGIYAMPGQTIQIPTAAGTATAIALPASPTPFTPLYALLSSLADAFFGAIANLEPTSGFALV